LSVFPLTNFQELKRYADERDRIATSDLDDCLRSIFDRHAVPQKLGETGILARRLVGEGSRSSDREDLSGERVHVDNVVSYCNGELTRTSWLKASKMLRSAAQSARIGGMDIEQIIADKDRNGDDFINAGEFRSVLSEIARFGKLSREDIDTIIERFTGNSADNATAPSHRNVSVIDFMEFVGMKYHGNLGLKIGRALTQKPQRSPADIAAVLKAHCRNGGAGDDPSGISHSELLAALAALRVYDSFAKDLVDEGTRKLFVGRNNGRVAVNDVMAYLALGGFTSTAPAGQDAESLLRLLLNQAKGKGLEFVEAFRYFDVDGDGSLSQVELEGGLRKLNLLGAGENSERLQSQIPLLVKKFDADGNGEVSLKEFLSHLGIESYVPNVTQKMTRIFAAARGGGLSIDDIFREFDSDGNGQLEATELKKALAKLDTFGQITDTDAEAVIAQFDKNGDGKVSMKEFLDYFTKRVDQASRIRDQKRSRSLVKKFCALMCKAEEKGATLEQIFGHFDRDGSKSVTAEELHAGLRSLPHCKDMSVDDIQMLVRALDADSSGEVSLDEFKRFVRSNSPQQSTADESRRETSDTRPQQVNRDDDHQRGVEKLSGRDQGTMLVDRIRQAAVRYGGVEAWFAQLDDDGDGVISRQIFERKMELEGVYDIVPRSEVDSRLSSCLVADKRGNDRDLGYNVASLLRFVEGKSPAGVLASGRGYDKDEEKDAGDHSEYDFSVDPETRDLERRLRGLGRALSKKGVDVADMFRSLDARETGAVLRAEFLDILSQLGLVILEKGKGEAAISSEARGNYDVSYAVGAEVDAQRRQMKQIRRVRGSDGAYGRVAVGEARKLLTVGSGPGSEEYKYSEPGSFKVRRPSHLKSLEYTSNALMTIDLPCISPLIRQHIRSI
jgi:calcium-binding protein CML